MGCFPLFYSAQFAWHFYLELLLLLLLTLTLTLLLTLVRVALLSRAPATLLPRRAACAQRRRHTRLRAHPVLHGLLVLATLLGTGAALPRRCGPVCGYY